MLASGIAHALAKHGRDVRLISCVHDLMISHLTRSRNLDIRPVLREDVRMTVKTRSSSLAHRAELLQQLLADDGIRISLEDARDLIIADAVERMLDRVPAVQ